MGVITNALLTSRQLLDAKQNAENRGMQNQLLQMQLQNAPAQQARQNKLLDLRTQGAEQDLMINRQKAEAEQAGMAEKRKQGALRQVGIFSQQALDSPDPRGFVATALENPQYAQIFADAGIDLAKAREGLNSPDFERNLQVAATMGDQVSADARFNRETAQMNRESDREFQSRENALGRQATLDAARVRAETQAEKDLKSKSASLRKEFRGLQSVKDYEATLPLIESARRAPDTRQGDLQLIYTVGKVYDPGSVVREGELKLTQDAAPFLQQLAGKIRGELGKGRLTPQTRAEMLEALKQRQEGYEQAYTRDYDTYSRYASDSGSDPFAIVGKRPETAYQGQGGANPPSEPTATGPNGEKIVLRNGQWVPLGR